jgi:hypothetical protein
MKVCDNADSNNRTAATNSTSLKIFLLRVQVEGTDGGVTYPCTVR